MTNEQLAQTQGWAAAFQAVATIVLVIVTGYYAKQNRDMAREMKRARELQVRPNIAPTMRYRGAGIGFLQIINLGPGSALHVEVTLRLEPGTWERRWSRPLVMPGEAHDYRVNDEASGEFLRLPQLTARYTHFRLTGSYRDVLGTTRDIDERIDIKEAWDLAVAANELLPHDNDQDAAEALDAIGNTLARLQADVHTLLDNRSETGPELGQLSERILTSLRRRMEPWLRRHLWRLSARLDRE